METDVVRTSASLRMTGFVEFCHCVHTKCCERGASVAFPSVGGWHRRLSVLVTSAMPSCAARSAETNRFPLSVRSRLESMKNPQHGGASPVTDIGDRWNPPWTVYTRRTNENVSALPGRRSHNGFVNCS